MAMTNKPYVINTAEIFDAMVAYVDAMVNTDMNTYNLNDPVDYQNYLTDTEIDPALFAQAGRIDLKKTGQNIGFIVTKTGATVFLQLDTWINKVTGQTHVNILHT
jgi:hypothetical protein